MTLHVNDSGTWREATGVYVNDGGVWRTITEAYVNDGGTWRTVYSSGGPISAFSGSSSVSSRVGSGTTSASITFNTDGTVTGAVVNNTNGGSGVQISGNWYSPTGGTPGNNYWIKGTVTAGVNATYTGFSTPTQLSVNREFKLATGVNVFASRSITIYIYSDSGGTNQVATGTIYLEVEDA